MHTQLILFILDLFQNSEESKHYNFFRKTISWNREQVKQYQFSRIMELLNYAYLHVPYYKNLFDLEKLNLNDIKSIEDFKHIPILTRDQLQDIHNSFVSDEFEKDKLFQSSSSGSTGTPVKHYEHSTNTSAGKAAAYFAYNLSGWALGKKTLHIWGNPHSTVFWKTKKSKIKRLIKNQRNLASTIFNQNENLEKIYNNILASKYVCIDGYTTAIYELAKFIHKNKLQKLGVDYVFTTAENLSIEQQQLIEETIGPVGDLYGCSEINSIAIKPVSENNYYVIDPHVFAETVQENDSYKNIVVTDLNNFVMPFIRYKIGDLIDEIREPDNNMKYQFSTFKKILGRDSDIIELRDGKKILPINVIGGTLFRMLGGIKKHKVTWDGKELLFLFEADNNFNFDLVQQGISKELKEYEVFFRIKIVNELLPNENGKFKYFEII